jgi:subtilisin family serine protease
MKKTTPAMVPAVATILTAGFAFLAAAGPGQERIIPNDPYFKLQVSFLNPGGRLAIERSSIKPSPVTIDAVAGVDLNITRAWTISTGSPSVVVALLDDGFAYWHDDVRDNIWTNPGETGQDATGHRKESNGIDDDGNGYVDDVMGWDFAFDDPDPDPYVFDGMRKDRVQPYWHSISALGIIGARGDNGLGVAGINWRVSMMLLKIGAQGIGRNETDTERPLRAARAIRYAADNGARVINWSGFVSDPAPQALEELRKAIDYAGAKGVLLVVGAGNSGLDIDREENDTYPACFPAENILTVAELDFKGELVRYEAGPGTWRGSNFGPRNVDIAAIGENFTTDITYNRSTYRLGAGTSCSAPVATGTAALVLSVRPGLTAIELKKVLMESASPLPALKGKVGSGGMVDAYRALLAAKR